MSLSARSLALVLALALAAGCTGGRIVHAPSERSGPLRAAGVSASEYAGAIAAARPLLDSLRAQRNYPAISYAVAVGDIIWSEASGIANLESGMPATVRTRFPIGSVSKPLTASVVLRLVDRGIIALDDPIAANALAYPAKQYPITARQLLSHQAGVRHYKIGLTLPGFTEMNLNRDFPTTDSALTLFSGDALKFKPDARFLYSTFGYTLLSAVIEGATHQSFLDVMRGELFVPAGLTSTVPDLASAGDPLRTGDYVATKSRGAVRVARATNSSYKWAGGGLLSTPTDLASFGAALIAGRIVSTKSRDEMFTPRHLSSGEENEQRYGLGWRVGGIRDPADTTARLLLVHHGGTAIGSEAAIVLVPGEGIAVAIAGNASTGGSTAMVQTAVEIARIFVSARRARVQPSGDPR